MTRQQSSKVTFFVFSLSNLIGVFVCGLVKLLGVDIPSSYSISLLIELYAIILLFSWSFSTYMLLTSLNLMKVKMWIRQYNKPIMLIYVSLVVTSLMILFSIVMLDMTGVSLFKEVVGIFVINGFVQGIFVYTITFNLIKIRIQSLANC